MAQPDDYSRLAGQILYSLILCAGIAKCWAISKRPTTNTKCVLGLMLVLSGWVIFGSANMVRTIGAGSVLSTVGFAILAFLGLASLFAAGIFSIIGLVELGNSQGQYSQGKKQAVWALVLLGVFLSIIATGFIRSVRQEIGAATAQPPGGKLEFRDLNFKYQIPGNGWIQIDKTKVNPAAAFMLKNARPQATFLVIAEKLGVEMGFDQEMLLETMKNNLRSVAPNARFLSEKPIVLNGMAGTEIHVELDLAGSKMFNVQAAFLWKGYAYQFLISGLARERQAIIAEADKLRRQFSLIDPNSVAHMEELRPPETFESRFGYNVKLKDLGWTKWINLEKDLPGAEFGVIYKNIGAFAVIPICLLGQDHEWDALVETGLQRLEFSTTDENLELNRKIGEGPTTMALYSAERRLDGEDYVYSIAVVQIHHFVYVLSAWHQKGATVPDDFLLQAISQVTYSQGKFTPPNPETFTAADRRRHALFFNDLGLFYYNAHLSEKALAGFEVARSLDKTDPVFLGNLLNACIQSKEFAKAVTHLENAGSLASDDKHTAMKAYCLSASGEDEKALEIYRKLFNGGYRNETYFTEYLALLSDMGETEEALSQVEKYLSGRESVQLRLWQASLLREKREFAKAITLLDALQKKYPSNTDISLGRWENYHAAERDAEALAICEQLLAKGNRSAHTYSLKGRTELALKHYREAKASFEAALAKTPADSNLKAYLDHVSGILGEGDNSTVKKQIPPVAVPETLLKNLPSIAQAEAEEYGAHYEYNVEAIAFERGKPRRTTQHAKVKIDHANALTHFSSLQFVFDPLTEEIFVNELQVRNAQGEIVSKGNIADYYVLDEGGEMATYNKVLHIPISGLRQGHSLEWILTRRDFRNADSFPFRAQTFSKYYPVARSIVYVTGDVDAVKSATSSNLSSNRIENGIYWQVDHTAVLRFEPYQQTFDQFLPTIWMGDRTNDWGAVAKDYLELIKDPMAPQPAMKTIAEQQVAGATNETEKILRLANFVQTNLTYKAIEFGRRGYVPNPPAKTMENRYGDCKDHTVLLHHLLKSVGIASHPGLVHTHSTVEKQLPSLDQFNHMILYVPSLRGGTFLDCTSKYSDIADAASAQMSGQEVFVVDPANPRFIAIPKYPADLARLHIERELKVANATDASVREKVTFHGVDAAYPRSLFQAASRDQWKTIVQRFVGADRALIEIGELEVSNLHAQHEPLTVQMTRSIKNCFHKTGSTMVGSLPASWELAYMSADPVDKRRSPFELAVPRLIQTKTTILPPEGYSLPADAGYDRSADTAFAQCKSSSGKATNTLLLTYEFRQNAGVFPPKDYAGFVEAMKQAAQILQPSLTFEAIKN